MPEKKIATRQPREKSRELVRENRGARKRRMRWWYLVPGLIFLSLLILGGIKASRIYDLALRLRQDLTKIQELAGRSDSRVERLKDAGPLLNSLRSDFVSLKHEVEPFLGMGAWLKWVPVHGGDLAAARDLFELADSLLAAADQTYKALIPFVEGEGLSRIDTYRITNFLKQARPDLEEAQAELERAVSARDRIEPDRLSPQVGEILMEDVDPVLETFQDVLTVAVEFPGLMGATNDGSVKYLLLVQNEDELRPTGGFITAADTLVIRNGRLSTVTFVNSGNLDNWDRPYPVAPWQLKQYMNSRVLIFRDSNWFTDFRTAAMYAEYLYSYSEDQSVDGVIAFDQHFLVELLKVTGPPEVEDAPYPIDANNVVEYMRAAKEPTPENLATPGWNNKVFLNKITIALIRKVFSGDVEWEPLFTILLQELNGHHLLVQLDNPAMTSLLEKYAWDGAVRPGEGDFLMVVDSNIGFNKTSTVIETRLSYEVDLRNPISPSGSLTVAHVNRAEGVKVCKHWSKIKAEGEQYYPVSDCYWNYLRVYTPDGTKLLEAVPQDIPDNWMIIKRQNPSQVDFLEEDIEGVQAFGTLQVVQGGESLSMNFRYALPADMVGSDPVTGYQVYRLKVQKQPGTVAIPLTIQIRFPKNSKIEASPAGAEVKGYNVQYQAKLSEDLNLEFVFVVP
ncbi:MAG: DUF4012 domain-containing protein [Chloroflexi bacterium]|nr:DUF4012 domain-containing protein [Chloroflexota bacterium]